MLPTHSYPVNRFAVRRDLPAAPGQAEVESPRVTEARAAEPPQPEKPTDETAAQTTVPVQERPEPAIGSDEPATTGKRRKILTVKSRPA